VQNQNLLERQEKLATLGTLAAGIAHEIRNPLTSIKARLYTLSKHLRENQPGLADAAVIDEEIGRLERIVQDVLDFARPSEPVMRVTPAEVPLREVHSLMTGALQQNGVRLELEPGDNPFISVDLSLIKQVLINLVRNAEEASPKGGTVTLRARSGHSSIRGRQIPVAILEVGDHGKGIPPEVEARLFDPFFTTKEAGTGLGLPIAARIVEKHGGLIQYQTSTGRGTTFGIILPAVPAPTGHGSSASQHV
jgi:signal transduction histidine kinase